MNSAGFQERNKPGCRKLQNLFRLRRVIRNWSRTLLDHLQFTKADYVCQLRNGASFHVRGGTDDRHVIFELFVDKIYPVQISPGETVIDIGAQIGCFTVWAAREGARVFAFEPFPENFSILERNVQRNHLKNVIPSQAAVGGTRERKKLFLPSDATLSGRYSLFSSRGEQFIEVDCLTLDDILSQNKIDQVDLLKVDCQGAEYEILYQASDHAIAKVSAIMVECETFEGDTSRSVSGMITYLEKMGFRTDSHHNLIRARRSPRLQNQN